jgi:beta-fructofuranosidase
VVRGPDGRWYLFYTGVTRLAGMSLQRIGLAVSTDLTSWHRVGSGPVLSADPRWYECVDSQPGASESWRDPYVFADPGGDGWHMLVTASVPVRDSRWRGVIGHARSHDLRSWEVCPPLTRPAGFGELEVAQVQYVDGRAMLIFSCLPEGMAPARRPATHAGTWTVLGGQVTDGWDVASATPVAHPSLYTGRLVRDVDGGWCLLGFRHTEDDAFHGEIMDPVPVTMVDGHLTVKTPSHST